MIHVSQLLHSLYSAATVCVDSDTFIVISPLLYVTELKHGAAWQICQGGALLTFTSERTTLTGLLGTYNETVREVKSLSVFYISVKIGYIWQSISYDMVKLTGT